MAAKLGKRFLLRTFLALMVGVVACALLLYGYAWWAVGKALSGTQFPEVQVHNVASTLSCLQRLHDLQVRGKAPWRLIDHSTVGKRIQERRLLEAARLVRSFKLAYGQNPKMMSDLKQAFGSTEGLRARQREELKLVASVCRVWYLGAASELLNCDGWRPTAESLSAAVEKFDPRFERFYLVGKHVVLYIPPWVKGEPAPSRAPRG